jgi:hypothetical protein
MYPTKTHKQPAGALQMVADPPGWFREWLRQHRLSSERGTIPKDAKHVLTQAEIRAAERLLQRTLQWRALPVYSWEERLVLAILVAYQSNLQRARGKKSIGTEKEKAEYRRFHVNTLLRYVVDKKYRKDPKKLATVMQIVKRLDEFGIVATEPQVRRDIHAALKLGPLPSW